MLTTSYVLDGFCQMCFSSAFTIMLWGRMLNILKNSQLNKNDIIKCWRHTFDSYIIFLSSHNVTSVFREFFTLARSPVSPWRRCRNRRWKKLCHNSPAELSFERRYIKNQISTFTSRENSSAKSSEFGLYNAVSHVFLWYLVVKLCPTEVLSLKVSFFK